jgi:GntR family transcriptional regulator
MSALLVEIDPHSLAPAYEQVRHQIEALVVSGALPAGARLPTIRQLANDLGLAVNTVARAYRELEAVGIVATGLRHGTSVTAQAPRIAATSLRERAARAARDYIATLASLGLSLNDAIAAIHELPSRR